MEKSILIKKKKKMIKNHCWHISAEIKVMILILWTVEKPILM